MKKFLYYFLVIVGLIVSAGVASAASAKETCQALQCQFQTCSSDTCADGIDTKACHPSHCRERYKGACKEHADMCVSDDAPPTPKELAQPPRSWFVETGWGCDLIQNDRNELYCENEGTRN